MPEACPRADGECFSRKRRLLKPVEFQRVLRGGSRVGGQYFRLIALKSDEPDGRLGLAIAKRSLKRAVDRNAAKRAIRESFRRQPESVVKNLDFVAMANASVRGASPAALRNELDRQWKQVRRKCAGS